MSPRFDANSRRLWHPLTPPDLSEKYSPAARLQEPVRLREVLRQPGAADGLAPADAVQRRCGSGRAPAARTQDAPLGCSHPGCPARWRCPPWERANEATTPNAVPTNGTAPRTTGLSRSAIATASATVRVSFTIGRSAAVGLAGRPAIAPTAVAAAVGARRSVRALPAASGGTPARWS